MKRLDNVEKAKVPRSKKDLITKLIHDLELLNEYTEKAFYKFQHEKYIGDIAGKLRVLLIKYRSNKPLLLKLMNEFKYERKFEVPQMDECTLKGYVCMPILRSEYIYTNEDLIRLLAEQMGSAHVDWQIDHALHHFMSVEQAKMNDCSWIYYKTKELVNRVLHEAMLFLLYLHYENILVAHHVEYSIRQILSIGTFYPTELCWSPDKRKEKGITPKPIKSFLEKYNIDYLLGRADDYRFDIVGLTSETEYDKKGPFKSWWQQNN